MTARAALAEGAGSLGGIVRESPFLDAVLLLCRAAGMEKERLLASLSDEFDPDVELAYRGLLARRLKGEPIAYILGRREFYGRDFAVDRRVLVPRPETELLVEKALSLLPPPSERGLPGPRCHDAFTGSGCVALTIAAERPDVEMSMSDASPDAIELARANSRSLLGRELDARIGDVLSAAHELAASGAGGPGSQGAFALITANPPYVPSAQAAALTSASIGLDGFAAAAAHEPISALDGGVDGLSFYLRIARESQELLDEGGVLIVEIGEDQGEAVAGAFEAEGFERIEISKDLAGLDRVVSGVRRAVRR